MRSGNLPGCVSSSKTRSRHTREFVALSPRSAPPVGCREYSILLSPRDKVFIHLQLLFAGVSLEEEEKSKSKTENASSRQIVQAIYQSASRIIAGETAEVQQKLMEPTLGIFFTCAERHFGVAAKNALEMVHVIEGKAWEDTPCVFRQLDSIGGPERNYENRKSLPNAGPKSILVLASRKINSELGEKDAEQNLKARLQGLTCDPGIEDQRISQPDRKLRGPAPCRN